MAPCRVCPRLFPTLSRGHTPSHPATGTMTAQHVSDMLRFWLLRLGVRQPHRWSGISMRSGTASLAALMKVDPKSCVGTADGLVESPACTPSSRTTPA
jgi:hypothetical protein